MTRVKVAMSRYTQAMRTLLAPRAESPQLIIIRTLHLCFYLTDPYLHSVGRMLEDAVQSAGGRASKIEVLSFSILTEVPELLCTEKHLARYGRRFMSFFQAYPNAFRRLTSLSLWALRFGDSDIPNLLASCLQLQHLTLQDCDNGKRSVLRIDAPNSQLSTLTMAFCSYIKVELINAPKLKCVVHGWVPILLFVSAASQCLTGYVSLPPATRCSCHSSSATGCRPCQL